MLSLPTLVFPLCPDLLLEEITCEGQILFLTVRREARMGTCPDCAQDSGKVHSRYIRTLTDVSWMDYAVRLRVQVRRFFCSNRACARTTFAEAFADLTAPYARRINRQVSRLRAIAKELGGRPAARESENEANVWAGELRFAPPTHAPVRVSSGKLAQLRCVQALTKLRPITTPRWLTTSSRSRWARVSIATSSAVAMPACTMRGSSPRTNEATWS